MLWQKGWLETRFRLLFVLGVIAFMLAVQYSVRNAAVPRQGAKQAALILATVVFPCGILVMMTCAFLAGAGIQTQPSLQATKGAHGSSLFTLSLPVSRLRLLAVRAAIGWLEAITAIGFLCWGTWLFSPVLRTATTPAAMSEYAVTLIACASGLYCLSVLLATFLDDQWRTWGTMIAAAALWWSARHLPLPASVDIVQAIGKGSPLIAHTMPWAAMAFSIALAAIFFVAALKIAQSREY
jgi:hypothetical protein